MKSLMPTRKVCVIQSVGNELGSKLRDYAAIGVSYYAVFDPFAQLGDRLLRVFGLHEGHYQEMSPVLGNNAQALFWLEQVELGLLVRSGEYEGKQDIWLRWCDRNGEIYLGGRELAKQAEASLSQERQKSERLAEQLKKLGFEPE